MLSIEPIRKSFHQSHLPTFCCYTKGCHSSLAQLNQGKKYITDTLSPKNWDGYVRSLKNFIPPSGNSASIGRQRVLNQRLFQIYDTAVITYVAAASQISNGDGAAHGYQQRAQLHAALNMRLVNRYLGLASGVL